MRLWLCLAVALLSTTVLAEKSDKEKFKEDKENKKIVSVPEPATYLLLGIGAAAILARRKLL